MKLFLVKIDGVVYSENYTLLYLVLPNSEACVAFTFAGLRSYFKYDGFYICFTGKDIYDTSRILHIDKILAIEDSLSTLRLTIRESMINPVNATFHYSMGI